MEGDCQCALELVVFSLNRTYLYDADRFLQFGVLIRVPELISVPNESRDSFILIKFNTLYLFEGDCQCTLELVV